MNGQRIHVVGPAHRVAIVGSILARRWAGKARELVLSPDPTAETEVPIVARPDQRSVHAELGLTFEQLIQAAEAGPVFAIEAKSVSGSVALPFSPFGMAKFGVEFHHFWQRGNAQQDQPDLTEFSLALSMQQAPIAARIAAIRNLPLQFGLELDRANFAALLLKNAASNGARLDEAGSADGADLIIDCRPTQGPAGWSEGALKVAGDCDIPGIEWQVCVNAARRFLALTPDLGDCEHEQREYSRLTADEADRIGDMRALLGDPQPEDTGRPALKRKLDVFMACGRIPTEDFEVFGQPEWLAALWARGIRPRRIDRMAKAMPDSELRSWLASMHREIRQLAQQGQPA